MRACTAGGGRLCVVRIGVTAAPPHVVQLQLQHGVLDESLVDARASGDETVRQVSLSRMRIGRTEASAKSDVCTCDVVSQSHARMACGEENAADGSEPSHSVPRET